MKTRKVTNEQSYEMGTIAARRTMLLHIMHNMNIKTDITSLELRVIQLENERNESVAALREICEDHGDNDWSSNLHLADVITKHLQRHL